MNAWAKSIGQAAALWLNPEHPLRKETVEALRVSTGLHPRQIELALANCFEELAAPKISEFLDSLTKNSPQPMEVYHILPANAFTAWVHGAVITLLFGHRCLLKPSAREPVFARAWKQSIEMVDPELASRIDIVPWDEKKLKACEAVVAYGADETLAKIRALLQPGARFAGFGHKLSIGVIFNEAMRGASHAALVSDICRAADPFRLQGCLSPQILYVEGGSPGLRPELEALLDVAPRVISFNEWPHLNQELQKFSPYLSCVGYAGDVHREETLRQELEVCHVSRVCPIGFMQKPPLSWHNGGIDLASLLN